MVKIMKLLSSFTLFIVLATGCQPKDEPEIDIVTKSKEKQMEILETYTHKDFVHLFSDIKTEARKLTDENGPLFKWVIRTLADEQMIYETDLSGDEVLALAKQSQEKDHAWKELAEDEYGVSVTEAEVDDYITEGPDKSEIPQHLAFAAALGISLQDLNHSFDRDIYEKHVMWQKLSPILAEKYDMDDGNAALIEKYNEEVKKYKN